MMYKLVKGEVGSVEYEVNNLLNDGWELYGSPSTVFGMKHDQPRVVQALIKRDD
tara:strand:- start:185 stop:346 length:162 start_codon:yes stop_codon:yes gene_type:complete